MSILKAHFYIGLVISSAVRNAAGILPQYFAGRYYLKYFYMSVKI
jgi:hypothetical protein